MCVTGGFVFSRDFSYHIPNLFNRCFMIDFRNIRYPRLALRKFNCSTGFSSKYCYCHLSSIVVHNLVQISCKAMNEELRPLMLRLSQSNINLTVIYAQLLRLLMLCRPKRRRWVHRCISLRPEQGGYGNLMMLLRY